MKRPNYIDIEEFRRSQNRKIWVVLTFMGTTNLVALAVVALVSLRPVPVIAFDKTGKALVFQETTRPGLETDRVRVEEFTKQFLRRFVGIDATRLQEDFKESLNMMTGITRELVIKEGQQVARREKYAGSDIRSRFAELELRIEDFDPRAMEQPIHLFAWGRQEFSRIYGKEPPVSHFFFAKMILERHPVREITPNGLLVQYIEYDSYEQRGLLDAAILKVAN